jgi:hypothetical protein
LVFIIICFLIFGFKVIKLGCNEKKGVVKKLISINKKKKLAKKKYFLKKIEKNINKIKN